MSQVPLGFAAFLCVLTGAITGGVVGGFSAAAYGRMQRINARLRAENAELRRQLPG